MYLNALSIRPPLQPSLPNDPEQSTSCDSLRETRLPLLRKCWPSRAPVYIQIRNKCIKQIGVCKKLRLSTCLKFRWESSVIMILKMTELRYRLCNLLCWRTNRNHIDPVKKEENIHHHSKHYKHSKGKTTKWYAMCMPVLYEGDQVSKILTIQNNMTAFV